jgi:hypothetical protein
MSDKITAELSLGYADAILDLTRLRAERDTLAAKLAVMAEELGEAIEDIQSWAGYASDYFKDKHDLDGCLKRYRDVTATLPETAAAMLAVVGAAQAYRDMEDQQTPRMFRGKELHELGMALDAALDRLKAVRGK